MDGTVHSELWESLEGTGEAAVMLGLNLACIDGGLSYARFHVSQNHLNHGQNHYSDLSLQLSGWYWSSQSGTTAHLGYWMSS